MATQDNQFLLRQICELNNAQVQFRVGMNLLTGKDVMKANPLVGRLLISMAADNGHRRAMWVLQIAYNKGKWDFPINEKKALYWGHKHITDLHRAADNNEQDAIETLDILKKFRKLKDSKANNEVKSSPPTPYVTNGNVFNISFKKSLKLDGETITYGQVKQELDNVIQFKKNRDNPEKE